MLSARRDSMVVPDSTIIPSPTEANPPPLPHEQANGTHTPGGIISLSTDNTSIMSKELSEFLETNMQVPKDVLEDGVSPDTVAASLLNVYKSTPFTPVYELVKENLVCIEGHSELLERLIWAVCDEGEGVLASRPCDLRFIKSMGERCKVTALLVDFDRVDPFSTQAVKLFENEAAKAQANGVRPRVLILSQPHSPPGRFYTRDILVEYMILCQRLGMHLVVDETNAMTTYSPDDMSDPTPFTSVLNIGKDGVIELDLCHVVHAIGKDISFFGVRYSVLISYHLPLLGAVRTCKPVKKLDTPTALSICTILDSTKFLSGLLQKRRSRLERHYAICAHFLKSSGIPYRSACAGTAIWVDLSAYISQRIGETWREKRRNLQDSLLRGGVHVSRAANVHDEDDSSHFKVYFSIEKETLVEGLKRSIPTILRAKNRLAKALNLTQTNQGSDEAPVNTDAAAKNQLVEKLVQKLLAEHDRSHILKSVGMVTSSDYSGEGRAVTPSASVQKRTNPSDSRKRRQFMLLGKPDRLDLGGTQAELYGMKYEERGFEL